MSHEQVTRRDEIKSTAMRHKYVSDAILKILTDHNGGPDNPKDVQINVKYGKFFLTISDKEVPIYE